MSKKGNKKKGGDDGEREEEEKVMVLEHKCRALQTRLGRIINLNISGGIRKR